MLLNPKISKMIGTSYSKMDCWSIVREFYSIQFGKELRAYYDTVPETRDKARALVLNSMKDFEEVKAPIFGDIILIKLFGIESHIAVYLGEGLMLHTSEHSGCIIERSARWEKLVVGYYRVRAKND